MVQIGPLLAVDAGADFNLDRGGGDGKLFGGGRRFRYLMSAVLSER